MEAFATQEQINALLIQYLHNIIAEQARTNLICSKILSLFPEINIVEFFDMTTQHSRKLHESLSDDLIEQFGEIPAELLDLLKKK